MGKVAKITYEGELRTVGLHLKSGERIITDAPEDNHGKGEAFSPTDLSSASLASCMLTIMGIKAKDLGIDLKGAEATVEKVMISNPRRIGEINVEIKMPQSIVGKYRTIFEKAARTCPVALSLHPEIKQKVTFKYQ